jgi:hypothetical protein
VGVSAGDARVDETRIDTGLRVDTKDADELADKTSRTAGGPAEAPAGDAPADARDDVRADAPGDVRADGQADVTAEVKANGAVGAKADATDAADEEPEDSTKVDEFRLSDLASEDTRARTQRSAPAKSARGAASANDSTDTATASARSPKDKM